MRVFVTGATGYIGGAVAGRLLAKGHTVLGLARSDTSAARLRAMGVEPIAGDLLDLEGLRRAAQQADGVIHAAFVHHDWSEIAAGFEADRAAVVALLDGIAGTGRPFLYTSGTWALGDTGKVPVDEDFPPNPLAFSALRPAVERLVLDAAERGVRSVVLRPGLVYGHGGNTLVNLLISIARQAGVARTFGGGHNAWSTVHLDDLGELFVLALERAPAGALFNAAAGEPVTMLAMAESVSRAMGYGGRVEPWPLDEARRAFPFADGIAIELQVSAKRARAQLGWQPRGPSLLDELDRGSYRAAINA